jgi:dTDP-D-glucose 4,6-dehydratase
MFITHNQIIDSIQSGKKQFVNTFVTDAKFKEELIKLIDAQAQAAKTSVDASLAIAQAFTTNVTEAMKKAVPAYTK